MFLNQASQQNVRKTPTKNFWDDCFTVLVSVLGTISNFCPVFLFIMHIKETHRVHFFRARYQPSKLLAFARSSRFNVD